MTDHALITAVPGGHVAAPPSPTMLRTARRRPIAMAGVALLLAGMLLGGAGCKTAEIRNVNNSPIGGRYTLDQIADKIVRAAKRRGWRARLVAPGRVEAVLNVRRHMARVDITFDRSSYSITYRDSENLGSDGRRIHRNYNKWVKTLDDDLRVELNF